MELCQIALRAQTYIVCETETHDRSCVVHETRREIVDIYFRVAPLISVIATIDSMTAAFLL